VAFGEAGAGFVGDEGAVEELRRREAEGAVEQKLTGGGAKEVFAADGLSDLHGGIVNDDGELIGGQVVLTPDDEIAEVLAGDELLWAEMTVGEGDGLPVGDVESPV
jgi:hypothetical protein